MVKMLGNDRPVQKHQDIEMETEWCVDYKELVSVISDKGILVKPIKHYSPGAVPLQNIRPLDTDRQKTKRRRPERKDTKHIMGS